MTESSITWSWTAVEGAIGYAVQVSHDEMFDATDQIVPTAETSFTASPLPPATSVFVRVAAAAGSLEAPLLSDWSTHVTGMTPAPDAPMPPPAPSGLQMSGATDTSITWSWDAVMSADGYEVQFNTEESFDGVDAVATTETSHTQMGLSEGTTGYLRVRSTAGDLASSWTAHLTATTRTRPATPSNLTATAGEGSITWTWDAVDGADSYHVQYSADGAFTDGGESMEVMDASYTKDGLGTGDTAYLRVRASGGTDDQARLLSGWSDPLRGMSATPMVPAVPSNLTATGGDGSITWTWDMVEGATGYQVQVSSTEDFSGAETMDVDGTSHTAEVAAGTTAYLRVRATGMGDPSAWATHVTGMSNAAPEPEPEPEPEPDPVMVTFSLSDDADSPHFLVADDDDDEATAMADVNTEIMVESNYTAVITPMFVDGAAGVDVAVGSNMPFTYVSWSLMQSAVLSDGATFMVQRTTVGANQEMEPAGDVVYITCGPFECVDGDTVPELSIANSAVCTAWDPEVEFQVGKVDNDVIAAATGSEDTQGVNTNDGIDLGIVTSSSVAMTVKHVFSGVAGGRNTEASGEAAKGSDETLAMVAVDGVITVNADEDDADTAGINEMVVCDNTYDDEDVSSKVDRPGGDDGCFRLIGPGAMGRHASKSGGPDYLSGWSIELSPMDADVSWGNVDWEEDPFEDLECGASDPIMVADHVDVCDMFDTEVSMATGKGWKPEVVFGETNQVIMWAAGATAATGHERMFKTLWFDDNLNEKIKDDAKAAEQADRVAALAATGVTDPPTTDGLHDLYNQNALTGNIQKIWELLTDSDMDLVDAVGDLGKSDLVSDSDNYQTPDNEMTIGVEKCDDGVDWIKGTTAANSGCGTAGTAATVQTGDEGLRQTHPDGKADNYPESTATSDFRGCSEDDGGDDADGTECDAEWVHDVTITFADGTFGCTTTRDITVTCEWDADGGFRTGRNSLPDAFDGNGDDSNLSAFLKCSAK